MRRRRNEKLLSLLLVFIMLLSLAPVTLASGEAELPAEEIEEALPAEEAVGEPAEEAVGEPAEGEIAADGEDPAPLNAWIEDGKLYWDECPGADYYWLYYYLSDGVNGYISTSTYDDGHFPYSDMPFDIQSYYEDKWTMSQTISISVNAVELRASGQREFIASSEKLKFDFVNSIYYTEMPYAWWDGTTIRWEKMDLSRFKVTDQDVKVVITIYENGKNMGGSRSLSDYTLSALGTSWDVSRYIDKPARTYYFTLEFTGEHTYSDVFTSEEVIGQELLDGYKSPERITRVDLSDLTRTLKSGDPRDPDTQLAPGSHCTSAYAGPWLAHESGDYYEGTAGQGKTYYYTLTITAAEGYTFGAIGTKVPVYLNGKKIGDAEAADYGGRARARMYVEYTVPITGLAIDEENFPDYQFREYIREYIDTEKDGYLTYAERNAVTEIDINGCEDQTYYWQLSSLEGIKYFPNLEYLYCNSRLESLNLSGNTKLIEVRASNDDFNSVLTTVNVTGCTKLESLSLYNQKIESLDLSTNSKLQYLDVDGNRLTALDLSGCPKLETLRCSGNRLTALNLCGNPALATLVCYGNEFKTLDISRCPKLISAYTDGKQVTWTDTINGRTVTHTLYYTTDSLLNVDDSVTLITEASALLGDVNGDGSVNPADRAALARYLAKWPDYQDINMANADVNADGNVNPADRAYLARHFAKWPAYAVLGVPV